VITTGKADWEKDITNDKESLAAALLEVTTKETTPLTSPPPTTPTAQKGGNLQHLRLQQDLGIEREPQDLVS
jgi:hypothetical protein